MDEKENNSAQTPTPQLYTLEHGQVTGPHSVLALTQWALQGADGTTLDICPEGSEIWINLHRNPPHPTTKKVISLDGRQPRHESTKSLQQSPRKIGALVVALLGAGFVGWALKSASTNNIQPSPAANQTFAESASAEEISKSDRDDHEETQIKTDFVEKRLNEAVARIDDLHLTLEQTKKSETTARMAAAYLAKRLESLTNSVGGASFFGKRVSLDVICHSQLLDFDKKAIEARLRHEFGKAGFSIVGSKDEQSHAIVFATANDLPITEGVNAAYNLEFECYAGGILGGAPRQICIHHNATYGYAGKSSNYGNSTRDFFQNETIKCIDALEAIEMRLEKFTKEAPPAAKLLEKAGIQIIDPGFASSDMKIEKGGSGLLISKKPLILTNHHVVSDCSKIRIFLNGKLLGSTAKVINIDKENDLALIGFPTGNSTIDLPMPEISPTPASLGIDVYTLGFPLNELLGNNIKYSSGSISSSTGMEDKQGTFQLSAPIQPGSSGGPVFSKSGDLLGIVVSTMNPIKAAQNDYLPQNVNFAINARTLLYFLKSSDVDLNSQGEQRTKLTVEQAEAITVRIESGR